MNYLIHRCRESINNRFKENRLVFIGEDAAAKAPSMPQEDGGGALSPAPEASPAQSDAGLPLEGHHFKKQKAAALQLVETLKMQIDMQKPHAKVFVKAKIDEIAGKFDPLQTEYEAAFKAIIAPKGKHHAESQAAEASLQTKADEYLTALRERIHIREANTHIAHHDLLAELNNPNLSEQAQTEIRAKIIKAQLESFRVEGAKTDYTELAYFMAMVLDNSDISRGGPDEVRDWFNNQLQNQNLIGRAAVELYRAMPRYKAGPGEADKFTDIIMSQGEREDALFLEVGQENVNAMAEALALRFAVIDGGGIPLGDNPSGKPLYLDLTTDKVYTWEELKGAVKEIVKATAKRPGGVKDELAAMQANAKAQEARLREIADAGERWYTLGIPTRDAVDHVDDLFEQNPDLTQALKDAALIRQRLAEKGPQAAAEAEAVAQAETAAAAARAAVEAQAKASEAHAEFLKGYAAARAKLLKALPKGITGTPAALSSIEAGAMDSIDFKNAEGQLRATVETTLTQGSPVDVTISYGPEGQFRYLEQYATMQGFALLLKNNTFDEILKSHLDVTASLLKTVERAIWTRGGKGGDTNLDIGNGISLQHPMEVAGQPGTGQKFTVAIKDGGTPVGRVELDLSGSNPPENVTVFINGGKPKGTSITLAQLRQTLYGQARYIREIVARAAKKMETAKGIAEDITLPEGYQLSDPTPPDAPDNPNVTYTIHLNETDIATIEVDTDTKKISIQSKAGGRDCKNATEATAFFADDSHIATFQAAETQARAAAKAATEDSQEEAIAQREASGERAKVKPGRADVPLKLANILATNHKPVVALMQSSFPGMDAATIGAIANGADLMKYDALANFIIRFTNRLSDARVGYIQEAADLSRITLSGDELVLLGKEVQQALGIKDYGESSRVEMALIDRLKTSSGQSLTDVLGEDNHVAEALSRRYRIRAGKDGGLTLENPTEETPVKHPIQTLDDLAPFLPGEGATQFAVLTNANSTTAEKEAAKTALRGATEKEAADLKDVEKKKAEIAKLLGDPKKVQELFGQMGVTEAIKAIMELWAAIEESFNAKPPDASMLSEVIADITAKPPRIPTEVIKKNQVNYARVLNQSSPQDVGQLLGAFLNPGEKGGDFEALFHPDVATGQGGLSESAAKDLMRYRRKVREPIQEYLRTQLGLDSIASIEEAEVTKIRTIVGYKSGFKYEIRFPSSATSEAMATVIKFESKREKNTETSEWEEVYSPVATDKGGEQLVPVTIASLYQSITGQARPAPEKGGEEGGGGEDTDVATAEGEESPPVDPFKIPGVLTPEELAARQAERDALETEWEKQAFDASSNPNFSARVNELRREYAALPSNADGKLQREWLYVHNQLKTDAALGDQYALLDEDSDAWST